MLFYCSTIGKKAMLERIAELDKEKAQISGLMVCLYV